MFVMIYQHRVLMQYKNMIKMNIMKNDREYGKSCVYNTGNP